MTQSSLSILVLGAGAWGSTLAHRVIPEIHDIQVWSRNGSVSLARAEAADIIVSAVSMAGVRAVSTQLQSLPLPPHAILVSATKGLDAETLRTPTQLWQLALPNHPVAVLSGPNLSREIQQGLPAAAVVASHSQAIATRIQTVMASERFRLYTSTDPMGVELGGILKNVMAIAAGACDGLQLGTNAKAALLTRGLREISRLGVCLGGQAETFHGLTGLGDLLATCTSPLSRNYQVGFRLAQGSSLSTTLAQSEGTAEGVNTARVVVELAKREGIPMPISQQVVQLLDGTVTPQQAMEALMARALKPESI